MNIKVKRAKFELVMTSHNPPEIVLYNANTECYELWIKTSSKHGATIEYEGVTYLFDKSTERYNGWSKLYEDK